MSTATCPFCSGDGGRVVLRTARWRLIHAGDPAFPGFYRLVWKQHLPEFTDLPPADRAACMEAIATVEQLMRRHLQPDKMNLAAFGNQVPHLHWHITARYRGDSHFPDPVWAAKRREPPAELLASQSARLAALEADLQQAFSGH